MTKMETFSEYGNSRVRQLKKMNDKENSLIFCTICEEEYDLPEDTETCPICGGSELIEI